MVAYVDTEKQYHDNYMVMLQSTSLMLSEF
jgi:hypothetical protein